MSKPTQNVTDPSFAIQIEKGSKWYSSGCSGFWRDASLVVPSALLVLYLGFQANRSVKKLRHRKSYVMIAFYALLWFAAVLNLAWSILQAWQCAPGKTITWNLLSLFTECGMLSLEISLLPFLLQENYSSGLEALAHTFMVSGSIVAVDILIQNVWKFDLGLRTNMEMAIVVFGFEVPLFINADASHWGKWSILFVHTLILTAVYSYILFVHYSKWKDRLPPRPSFYNYVVVMFITNVIGLFSNVLSGIGFGFGLWLCNIIVICRHSLYLPFLYATFLADFFQEEDWLLDSAYYSEMKDAGFFDTDWE